MADTSVPITAGSGTDIDTRTESTNGNHRQVVVLGDPATNAGVAPVDATKGLAVDLSATGANTNKLLVTPDLPSGASTAAKQPALGTAGTASADVISVQGIASMTALKVDGSAVTQPVSGTVTASGPLTDTQLRASAVPISVATIPSHAVTNAGTFAVQSTNQAGSAIIGKVGIDQTTPGTTNGVSVTNTSLAAKGTTASGASLTDAPITVGGLAKTALPTAVSDGQVVNAMGDKFGRQVVLTGTLRDLVGTQTTTISASTSETTIVTAIASTFNDLTALVVSNTSATAARVDFRDTTAGSVLFSLYIPAGDARGVSFTQPVPQTSVNTNWTAQSSASVTDLRVYAVYQKNK